MKKVVVVLAFSAAISFIMTSASPVVADSAKSGEELFKQNCAVCHVDGGNIVNPKKTLHKADREANNVKTVKDIIGKMRNPGPGMIKFDEKTIPDKEAKEIAEYILKTFNK
ncbi:MAG TPA: c-type cytochrome [Nitrospirota bacterium]|nr:c-type cytochrome [Nitrospirota bacterium]